MITKGNRREKNDVVEFIKKKNSVEWSSTSTSKTGECKLRQPTTLKTLPQANWHNIDKVTAELKATLPTLRPSEVRRFRIPYHEAIILELEEQGYKEAAYYLKELLDLDERVGRATPGTLLWKKPYLKDQKDFINHLRDGLLAYEMAKEKNNYVNQATALLDVALYFQTKTMEWWWLTERLYQSALSAAELIEDDDCHTVTLIQYLYGRFLFDALQNPEEALNYLKEARETSERKTWNASEKLGQPEGSIFKECNTLLYRGLLIIAQKVHSKDPNLSLELCSEALERAYETECDEYVVEVLYELGKSYVRINDFKHGLQTFSKLLAMAKRIPDVEGICNAHMELAFTYKKLNDDARTEKHLSLFKENAALFGLTAKLAHAHYYTGEHYLSQGKTDLSTIHLEVALDLYNRLSFSEEADRARCIAGISKGQERIKEYLDLVLRCGQLEQNATLNMCRWKSHRHVFWHKKKDEDDKSDMEMTYENSESIISASLSSLKPN